MADVPLSDVAVGDTLVLFPHEICPVDGTVTEGRGIIDESFLTGEPFKMFKTPGSGVISGAINGDASGDVTVVRAAATATAAGIARELRERGA